LAAGVGIDNVQQQFFQLELRQLATESGVVEEKRQYRFYSGFQQRGDWNGKDLLADSRRPTIEKTSMPIQEVFQERIADIKYQGSIFILRSQDFGKKVAALTGEKGLSCLDVNFLRGLVE
jgi:hypothetical protein